MATCSTSKWVPTAPYIKLTVTESSSTDTTATLSWTLQYIASDPADTASNRAYTVTIAGSKVKSGSYDIDRKVGTYTIATGTKVINKTTAVQKITFSCWMKFELTWSGVWCKEKSASGSISVAKKTSYTVSYNANGGSGAPSSQTKWHGTNLTLSTSKPSRTGYSFLGWSTSSTATSATWAAGGSYTANASDVLYAVWKANTYTVSYDANGGSGAPGNQIKTHGQTLTLSSTKPTRANYNFIGWGASSSSTTISYKAGDSYTANTAITLYAVWELAYTKPVISNLKVNRCDSSGTSDETGTYAKISFDWSTCTISGSSATVSNISIAWGSSSAIPTGSGSSGSISQVIGDGTFDGDSSYEITVTVTDSKNGSTSKTITLSGTKFPIDFKAGGTGVAFGKPAETDNLAEFGYQVKFAGGILQPILSSGTDLDTILTPNIYSGQNITNIPYSNVPFTSGSFTLRVEAADTNGQIKQTITQCDKNKARIWERFYYMSGWGDWKCIYDMLGTILWSGEHYMTAGQTCNLSENISKQPSGICLVFSEYYDAVVKNQSFVSFFVSKKVVSEHSGRGHSFMMCTPIAEYFATKYLYISDDKITGHDDNGLSGTGASGIKYTNTRFVLRYVIGV